MVNQLSQHSVLSESAFPTSFVLCLFFYGKFLKKSTNNPLPEKNGKKNPSQTFVKMYSFVSEHCHAERERERDWCQVIFEGFILQSLDKYSG